MGYLSVAPAGSRTVRLSVTDSIFSPIAPIADIWLEVVEANFEGFRSMAATMALAMTLSVAVAGKRREKPKPSSGPRSR